jgi:hypothetical protein
MMSESTFRTATLLVVLFSVSPILTCAALIRPTNTTEHACCEKKAPAATEKPCCTVDSATQTLPVTRPAVETILGAAFPVCVEVDSSFGPIETLLAGTSLFSRRNLFLNFHQLLI